MSSYKENRHLSTAPQQQGISEQERAEAQRRARTYLEEHQISAGAEAPALAPITAQFLRPAHEDDDGYDPYSDRIEVPSFYEEDPWR